MRTIFLTLLCVVCNVLAASAQTPPSVHIEGRNIVDSHGNKVVMHGVMDTPNCWFNGGIWGWYDYNNADAPAKCVDFFDKMFAALTSGERGGDCTVFRLHLDPCWTNGNVTAKGFTKSGNDWIDPDGVGVGGESCIVNFDKSRLSKFFTSVYWPIIDKALKHGLHVVVRPPGVCPSKIRVGGYYQEYLMTVWDFVSKNSNIQKYAGQVSIELANEPVGLVAEDGSNDPKAMHDFFQPIVDKIRANGYTGIIWIPGTGYQSNYREYEEYPIEGYNIGYAVHVYPGWYNNSDEHCSAESFIKSFGEAVPVVRTNPIIVTEIDWSPGVLKLDANGKPIDKGDGNYETENYGTWGTARTSTWGMAFKAMKDYYGNISMTVTHIHDLIVREEAYKNGKTVLAHGDKEKPEEGCAYACADWYAEYKKENQPFPDFKNLSTNMTANLKNFINPVIAADFPDPDVTRLGDTYYFLSTTMQLMPGATVLKSKDLVNWEFCCNPLEQLSTADKYSLIGGKNSYAGGMWAGAIEAHDGKLYILINGNDAGGFVLSTDDPEGKWDVKRLSRSYYDPGMIFEGDKIYIVCGINHLNICELDKDWNFIKETNVVKVDDKGLEGSHLYHIGDYYYIYATYGGWPTGQTIFRSKSITGPYEEKLLVDKFINNAPNTVHQGALIEIPETGEWWTMLMEDKGAIGRLPSLHPVTWKDGWPTICKNGVPQLTYAKPNVGTTYPTTILPTNDNFRTYQLGKQWQWNHNAPQGQWSLMERPGYLRLHTSSVVDDMMQARGTLTQRIFAFHKSSSPYGLDTSKPSTGTIALDVSGMQPGDMAGIAVQQDPYAMLAVTMNDDGTYSLVWKSGSHTGTDNFTPATKTKSLSADEFGSGEKVIFLRAKFNCGNSEATFSYSLDNKKWTSIGNKTTLRFNLSVFVGARWAIFNYATRETGGYVDVDWFSTEETYDESAFAPAFEGYSSDMLTATSLAIGTDELEVMVGTASDIQLVATFADGHTENVAAQAKYKCDWPELFSIANGRVKGLGNGTATLTATYTDPMGNTLEQSFRIVSTFFPFSADFIKNVWDTNTYDPTTRTFKTAPYGQIGWEYSNPVDMSGYKYLVVLLDKAQSCDADMRIYTQPSIWGGSCYIRKLLKRNVLRLSSINYTDGDAKGKPVDVKNIYKVVFWSNGSGVIDVADMYLTNNSDGSREEPTGIDSVDCDTAGDPGNNTIYDLQGRRVANPSRGIYIVNGRKVFIK